MALIDDALDYLQITWEDAALQRKLEGGLARGKVLLDDYAGAPQDYDTPGMAQGLLFDYLRYVRADASEMFEINYQRDLIRLRMHAISDARIAEEAAEDA